MRNEGGDWDMKSAPSDFLAKSLHQLLHGSIESMKFDRGHDE